MATGDVRIYLACAGRGTGYSETGAIPDWVAALDAASATTATPTTTETAPRTEAAMCGCGKHRVLDTSASVTGAPPSPDTWGLNAATAPSPRDSWALASSPPPAAPVTTATRKPLPMDPRTRTPDGWGIAGIVGLSE